VFGRAPSVIHASGMRQMFVEYYTVFARMRRRARYVSNSVRGSCVIRQCFLSPKPKQIGQFLDVQARTNPICA